MEVVPQGGVPNTPVGAIPIRLDSGPGFAGRGALLRSDDHDPVYDGPGEYEAIARGVLHVRLFGGQQNGAGHLSGHGEWENLGVGCENYCLNLRLFYF